MTRRSIALALALVAFTSLFFGVVFGAAQGGVFRDPGATVLTCSAETPIPEPVEVTDFEDLDPRHRPPFVRATQEQFADVAPASARYYESHRTVRYRGRVYHCETSAR